MRKLTLILMTVLLIAVPLVNAQGDPAQPSLDWLAQQQAEDGSYSDVPLETAIVAIPMGLLGETNTAAMDYLDNYATETEEIDLTTSSFMIMAAVANDVDPSELGGGSVMATFTARLQEARGENIGELCVGLLAMHAMGQDLPPTALLGLGLFQLPDGGFPEELGNTVSSNGITGLCLPVLVLADNEEGVTNAVQFLTDNQNEDGGWGTDIELTESNNFATTFALMGLHAAGADLMNDWGTAVFYLLDQQSEDGSYEMFAGAGEPSAGTTALAVMVFRGLDLLSFNEDMDSADGDMGGDDMDDDGDMSASDAPVVDENWLVVAEGFGMDELDSADDFLVTVVDPFTDEELYGVQIINWVAEYSYTGYIIEEFLPGEILLYLADNEPTTWDNLNNSTLELLPAEELAKLPEDIQARIQ